MSRPADPRVQPIPVRWKCEPCGAAGSFDRLPDESCDVTWERVLAHHPNCPFAAGPVICCDRHLPD